MTFDIPFSLATVVSDPFEENTYLAYLPDRKDCLVFDPGLEPGKIFTQLDRLGLEPAAILITHGHSDHIGGNAALLDRWPNVPLVIGQGDAAKLTDPWQNLSAAFGVPILSPPATVLLAEGDVYRAAGFELEVLEIPGHSSGHVVFVAKTGQPWVVFGGDVLFAGSIGRTDFPDGSFPQLKAGIHEKLFTLPDDTIVLTGHGEPTTVGVEKRTNPYVGLRAKY